LRTFLEASQAGCIPLPDALAEKQSTNPKAFKMSQSSGTTPSDTVLIPATNPAESEALFFTVAELRAAMSPIGYMTPADQVNAAAAAAAQATANAAIPSSTLGQPLGPAQLNAQSQIPLANLPASVLGSSHYLGTWNASTNTPLIQSGVAPNVAAPIGGYYIVSVAGSATINGVSAWNAGDWIIWNGSIWSSISGQVNPVSSVAGLQGAVTAAQLSTALAGPVALSAAGGELNVVLGTSGNTAAAGNDTRITGAAQSSAVYTYLANVAAIAGYTGNAPGLHTAGYYAAGDGGGGFYTQTNTAAPAITDGEGRDWYLQDVQGEAVNIRQFGAKSDGVTDIQPAWVAADTFAATYGKAVFIPSAGSGTWALKTPMLATAIYTHGEAADVFGGHGTTIRFEPPTITDAITALTNNPNGGYFLVSDLVINGADTLPTAATIVSSGWLPALASAACAFSGSVMTATGTTGSWAVGQTVCGPGMTNYCTITSFGSGTGGDGTYNLSAAQTVTGSITVTATGYPNLSAFKAGTAAFRAGNSGTYRNCRSGNCKFGLVLDTPYGHVFAYNCGWNGLFGVYCRQNGYDYLFDGCDMVGIWCAVLAGTGVVSGTNSGINFRAVRSHFGFAPVGVDTLNDGGTNTLSGVWEFFGCSFEAVGEAMLRTLPTSGALQLLFDMWPNGSVKTAFQFPASLIGTPNQYYFYLPGQLAGLKSINGNGAVSGADVSGFPSGSVATAYIGSLSLAAIGDMDLDALGTVVYGARPYSRLDARNPDLSRDYLKRREQIIRADLLEKGNLLHNPEVATNWAAAITGTTINVLSLASLTANGGALSGITIPTQIYRESNNPNVIVITNPSGTPSANLGVSAAVWNVNRSICLHGWVFSSGSGMASNVTVQLVTNNTEYMGGTQVGRGGTVLEEVMSQGERLSDYAATSLTRCNIAGSATAQTIYIVGLMVSYDRPSAPNQLPAPYAPNGLFVGAENNGLTAAQAPQIIAFQTTPPAGTFPNGSIGINVAGLTPVLYHYVNGAWVVGV
jgi:hypothetical protein